MTKMLGRAERLEIASESLYSLGISHSPEDLNYKEHRGTVTANDVGSGLDVEVTSWRKDPKFASDFSYTPLVDPKYLLNGQLRGDILRISGAIRQGHNLAGYVSDVAAISSPGHFNLAQIALGNTPGVSAFKFERMHGHGEIPLEDWIGAFARKSAPVADATVLWSDAQHDLDSRGHALSWFYSDDRVVEIISKKAQSLIDYYGDKIALPRNRRPEYISEFAHALEHYGGYVKPLFDVVAEAGKSAETLDSERLAVSMRRVRAFQSMGDCESAWENTGYNLKRKHHLLKTLGLIGNRAVRYETAQIAQRSTIHIAKALLRADEVWPRHDLGDDQKEARRKALSSVGYGHSMY